MQLSWSQLKTYLTANTYSYIHFIDFESYYLISASNGPFSMETTIVKIVDCTDALDFETNWMHLCNKSLNPKVDMDGAQIVNPKLASEGRKYQSLFTGLKTSDPSSLIAKDETNTDDPSFILKCYKADGTTVLSDDTVENKALITLTSLEWYPSRSYDIQGFCIYQGSQPTSNMFLSAISAFLIPKEYGGSIISVRSCNLKHAPFGNREIDWVGDSASAVVYDPVNYSHAQQIKIYHDAGYTHELMFEVIWYV